MIKDDEFEHGDLFGKLRKWLRKDWEHSADWRKEAKEDFEFVAGEQYSAEERDHLKEQLRPMIVFNRIDPLVRAVSGAEITGRQEVKYFPREMGDARANDILTQAAQWFRDQSDAEDEESDAFLDNAICGMGWTETRLDYDDNEDGAPLIDRIDPLAMAWDCSATKKNLADARRVHRIKKMPLAEAMEFFPDAKREDFGGKWAVMDREDPVNGDPHDWYQDDGKELGDDDFVTVIETQWWERESRYITVDPMTGQRRELTQSENKTAEKRFAMLGMPYQSRRIRKKVYKRAFYSDAVLEEGDAPCEGHFTYQAMTGFRDNIKGTFYGIVRAMKDPQRWANKWLSQQLHILNSSAKGGVMMEQDAVEDQAAFEESYARADAVTYVKQGALINGKIQPKPAASFPAGFYQMMEFAVSSVRDVTGINLELLGMREADQAASLEYQRRQSAMTILATLFDGMRRYRKSQGRVMLYYITEYLSDGRLIRIVGEEGTQYIPLMRQSSAEYDIIVDDAPTTPNQKEQTWQMIGPMFMSLPPQMQLALIEYAPLPETVIEKIKEALQELAGGQAAQAAQEAQQAQFAAEMAKTKSETIENLTNARHNAAQELKLQQEIDLQALLAGVPGMSGVSMQ